MIGEMKKRDELADKFVGKNILLLTTDTNILSTSKSEKRFDNLRFKEMKVIDITKDYGLVAISSNDTSVIIEKDVLCEAVIENIEKLESILKRFIEGNNINITYIEDLYQRKLFSRKIEKINIKNLTTLKVKIQGGIQEENALDCIPAFKVEIMKDKPILFQFASRRDTFEIRGMDDIGYRDFEKGCFYGYKELDKAIDDICKHYSQFLLNEDESDNKNSNILKKIKNVFKKN